MKQELPPELLQAIAQEQIMRAVTSSFFLYHLTELGISNLPLIRRPIILYTMYRANRIQARYCKHARIMNNNKTM